MLALRSRGIQQIRTGEVVHWPAKASLETIHGALWLEVENGVAPHVNACLIEQRPIEVDGVSYAVREMRARPGEGAMFRLVRL